METLDLCGSLEKSILVFPVLSLSIPDYRRESDRKVSLVYPSIILIFKGYLKIHISNILSDWRFNRHVTSKRHILTGRPWKSLSTKSVKICWVWFNFRQHFAFVLIGLLSILNSGVPRGRDHQHAWLLNESTTLHLPNYRNDLALSTVIQPYSTSYYRYVSVFSIHLRMPSYTI